MTTSQTTSGAVDRKYYEVATPASFAERLVIKARDRIYDDFIRICRPSPQATILDIGVSDVIGDAANVLERRYPHLTNVTAVGLGTAEEFRATFPYRTQCWSMSAARRTSNASSPNRCVSRTACS